MKEMIELIRSALPWIAMGLFAACSCVMIRAKAEGKALRKRFLILSWSPAACFFLAAILDLTSGHSSGGTTWLVLGTANAVMNYANIQPEKQERA